MLRILAMILLAAALPANAAELSGTIQKLAGETIVIKVNSQFLPRKGDEATVSTDHATLGTLSVGTWQVTKVTKSGVVAAKLNATGAPAVGMSVVINSANPIPAAELGNAPAPAQAQAQARSSVTPPPPPPKQEKNCRLSSQLTMSVNCPQNSVYAGPLKPDEHGGACVSAGACKLYSWKTMFQDCGPYAVYAGPRRADIHGGYCVLLDEQGWRLRSRETDSQSCGQGVYAGPHAVNEHFGSCLDIAKGGRN